MLLADARIPRIAIENPVGFMSTAWRKPDQIIEPWMFGEPWRKKTCLWLKGLPPLQAANPVEPTGYWVGGQRIGKSRTYTYGGGRHRNAKKRSLTFQGIADAMAAQWGGPVDE